MVMWFIWGREKHRLMGKSVGMRPPGEQRIVNCRWIGLTEDHARWGGSNLWFLLPPYYFVGLMIR
jgi:hypothetical protein